MYKKVVQFDIPHPRKEKSKSVKRKALHNSKSSNFPNKRPAVHSKEKDLEVSTAPKDQFDDLNTQYTRLHADWLNLRDEVTQLKLENQQLREKQESFSFKSVAACCSNRDLAYRFNISQSKVSKIIRHWVPVMSEKLKDLIVWPSREAVRANMPREFRHKFSNCRCITRHTEDSQLHSRELPALRP
ncbi:hypothetical protein CAPTEDRAFT_189760 [Capitella teleta]|uniref:Transposase Helix-turn-helix domain-containing protein n=1 Tax=Capitella teleta TaxID=283909 RepID=R7V2Y1_CAPTE|nr:hypothetical protein CAPTEDRAFT_189760 [Capitella teleta]|eukprot:ELU10661.1 hypothetical protein CAPTEDRAFT_189760 [Capitella teleta]